MPESKEKVQKLYPSTALPIFAKRLLICKQNIYTAVEEFANEKATIYENKLGTDCSMNSMSAEAIAKRIQRNQNINLTAEEMWKVLYKAVDLRIDEIKSMSTRKNFSPNEDVEKLKKNRAKIEPLIKEVIENLFMREKTPLINGNKASSELIEDIRDVCKMLISGLPCEIIYIFSQNLDAFLVVEDEDEIVSEYCEFLCSSKKSSRELLLKEVIQYKFGEISNALNNQHLLGWIKIRTDFYSESGKLQISKYHKKNIKRYTKDELIENAFKELNEKADEFPAQHLIMPIWMVLLSQLLLDVNDVNLLIDFLFCNSEGRELILAKAKELSELEKGTTPQIAD